MTAASEIFAFVAAQMADPETHWSLGTFGAIAEFSRDVDEPVSVLESEHAVAAVTDRGGIRIDPNADMRPCASETATSGSWNHRVALCLPADRCVMGRRAVLTELGPDADALRPQDREAILFDLGLDALQADICIRVGDPDVIAQLRAHAGTAFYSPGNPAASVILASNPHRVFISRLGRIEVFQSIPPSDGASPEGPHTHVLPKLLRLRRTHAATEPIPDGLVPCAHLYPAHPAKDAMGRGHAFDSERHRAFQAMLDRFGDPDLLAVKQQVVAAVVAGRAPAAVAVADNRFARATVRVALRQLEASAETSPALLTWLRAHERSASIEAQEGQAAEPHGH